MNALSMSHPAPSRFAGAPVAGNTYNSGTVQASLNWSPDFFGQHAAELQAALAQRRLAVDLRARQLDTRLVLRKALGGGWTDDTAP